MVCSPLCLLQATRIWEKLATALKVISSRELCDGDRLFDCCVFLNAVNTTAEVEEKKESTEVAPKPTETPPDPAL